MLRRPLHCDEEEILGEHLKRKFTADFGFFCLNYQNVLSDLNVCTAMNMGSRISMGNSHFSDRVRSTNQFSVRRNSIWALSVSRRPKGSDLHWHGWMAEGWGSWRRRRRCKWVRITGENTFHLDQRPTPFVRCRSWWYKYYFGVNKHIPSRSPKR